MYSLKDASRYTNNLGLRDALQDRNVIVSPGEELGRDGGSFQECTATEVEGLTAITEHGRYCTIRDHEYAPPTSESGRKWKQIYRTPDDTE